MELKTKCNCDMVKGSCNHNLSIDIESGILQIHQKDNHTYKYPYTTYWLNIENARELISRLEEYIIRAEAKKKLRPQNIKENKSDKTIFRPRVCRNYKGYARRGEIRN